MRNVVLARTRRTIAGIVGCAAAVVSCSDGVTGPGEFTSMGHTPFPLLTKFGGPTLSPMRLVVVAASNDHFRDSLFRFGDDLLASNWWRQVSAPYSVSAVPGALKVTGPPLVPDSIKLADALSYLQASIASTPSLAPNGHTMYVLFLPAGVVVGDSPFCGAHYPYGTGGDAFAFIRRCGTAPDTTMVPLTVTASHEVIEAASDPALNAWILVPGSQVWTANPFAIVDYPALLAENADLCPSTRYVEGAFTYTRSYSNAAVLAGGDPCVPALNVPYFNTSTLPTWYGAASSVSIPVTGWSTGPVADWGVTGGVLGSSGGRPTVTLSGDSVIVNGVVARKMNNGRTLTVTVTFPPGTAQGSWALIDLRSARLDAAPVPPPGADLSHHWYVGVWWPFGR